MGEVAKAKSPLTPRTIEREEMTNDISELATAISHLSPDDRTKIDPAFQKVCECSGRRRHVLGLVQEALEQLKLDMKYLMFDLEATRKERDRLRSNIPLDDRL